MVAELGGRELTLAGATGLPIFFGITRTMIPLSSAVEPPLEQVERLRSKAARRLVE